MLLSKGISNFAFLNDNQPCQQLYAPDRMALSPLFRQSKTASTIGALTMPGVKHACSNQRRCYQPQYHSQNFTPNQEA